MPLLLPAKFCLGRQVEIISLKPRFETVFRIRIRWIRKEFSAWTGFVIQNYGSGSLPFIKKTQKVSLKSSVYYNIW
jgi:hypothetical protein